MEKTGVTLFTEHGDARGYLVALEGERDVPFAIQRIFYVYGADGQSVRGQHANRHSCFMMLCLHGACKVRVRDGAQYDETFLLDGPTKGLYLPAMTWKDMFDFTPDAVLLVLSDAHYDGGEYIRDYAVFEAEAKATTARE